MEPLDWILNLFVSQCWCEHTWNYWYTYNALSISLTCLQLLWTFNPLTWKFILKREFHKYWEVLACGRLQRATVILEGFVFFQWFTNKPLNDKEPRWLLFHIEVEGCWIDWGNANYCLLVVQLILCRLVKLRAVSKLHLSNTEILFLIMMESGWMKAHTQILTSVPFILLQCSQSGWHQKFYGMSSLMKSISPAFYSSFISSFESQFSRVNFFSIGQGDKWLSWHSIFLCMLATLLCN
jgi:hypothetical protein